MKIRQARKSGLKALAKSDSMKMHFLLGPLLFAFLVLAGCTGTSGGSACSLKCTELGYSGGVCHQSGSGGVDYITYEKSAKAFASHRVSALCCDFSRQDLCVVHCLCQTQGRNETMCATLPNSAEYRDRDSCYSGFAMIEEDPSICGNVEDNVLMGYCVSLARKRG